MTTDRDEVWWDEEEVSYEEGDDNQIWEEWCEIMAEEGSRE